MAMGVLDHLQVNHRRLKAQQIGKGLSLQGLHDRAEPLRTFRMATSRVMFHASLMEI